MRDRTSPRLKKRISCALTRGDRHHSGIVLDISSSGLFVQTNAKPRPGEEVGVELSVPGRKQSVSLRARVARAKLVPPQLLTIAQGGLGLHIDTPPAEYLTLVEQLTEPVKMERVSILSKTSDDAPEKPITQQAHDRIAALRQRSSSRGEAPLRISNEKRSRSKPSRFRVRLVQVATSVSRNFIVSCPSEAEARERVHTKMGDGWEIEGVERL